MRNLQLAITCLFLTTLLPGCSEEAPPPPPKSRPVKSIIVGGAVSGDVRQFPGVVDAVQKADLSFRVDGKLEEILVKEGEEVEQGKALARLDPTDYQIRLNDRKASFATAKANYDRAKQLVEKGAISRVEHDKIRADFYTARANLEAAEQDMKYTTLKATFDGVVAKRHVENFEEIRRTQKVFTLQDVSQLEIKIDIPESLMIQLHRAADPDMDTKRERRIYAVFDQIEEIEIPLSVKEVSTTADANTRTFEATLLMNNPEDYNVLPGMTATVHAEIFAAEAGEDISVELPLSAVVADAEKNATVWVVDEATMTVAPQPVETGLITSDSIAVSGLRNGSRIVTAGAAFLQEGMKVTLLETGEQPE